MDGKSRRKERTSETGGSESSQADETAELTLNKKLILKYFRDQPRDGTWESHAAKKISHCLEDLRSDHERLRARQRKRSREERMVSSDYLADIVTLKSIPKKNRSEEGRTMLS